MREWCNILFCLGAVADMTISSIVVFLGIVVISSRVVVATTTSAPVDEVVSDVSSQRCSAEEQELWNGNREFGDSYSSFSIQAFGNRDTTMELLGGKYPVLSTDCLTCFGEATACGATKCYMVCMVQQWSEKCQTCFRDNCQAQMITCTGVSGAERLPTPPRPQMESSPKPVRVPRLLMLGSTRRQGDEGSTELYSAEDREDSPDSTNDETTSRIADDTESPKSGGVTPPLTPNRGVFAKIASFINLNNSNK